MTVLINNEFSTDVWKTTDNGLADGTKVGVNIFRAGDGSVVDKLPARDAVDVTMRLDRRAWSSGHFKIVLIGSATSSQTSGLVITAKSGALTYNDANLGTVTNISFSTSQSGYNLWYRARVFGGVVQTKSWSNGSPEPEAWSHTVDISGISLANGNFGIQVNQSTTQNYYAILYADQILLSDPTPVTVGQTIDLGTPNASMQTIDPTYVGLVQSAEVDLVAAALTTSANEVTVETKEIVTVDVLPTRDFGVVPNGTVLYETAGLIETGTRSTPAGAHAYFLFDLPANYQQVGLVSAQVRLVSHTRTGGANAIVGRITSLNESNYYNSTVADEVTTVGPEAYADLSSVLDEDFIGVRVRPAAYGVAMTSKEYSDPAYRPVLRLTYELLPLGVDLSVPTPDVSVQANEPTIVVIDPISETVDLTTAAIGVAGHSVAFEEIRESTLVPSQDGYRTQGASAWNFDGNALSLNYDPNANLSTVIVPQGTAAQIATINRALERIDFPYEILVSAIQAKYGRSYVPVTFEDLPDGESGGTVLGEFRSGSGSIVLDVALVNSTVFARSTLAHEIAHLVDHVLLNNAQRVSIWNAMHSDPAQRVHASTVITPGVIIHHGHAWSGTGNYFDRVAEGYANAFVKAYSDVYVSENQFTHPATVAAGEAIRAIITPTMPSTLGPFPSRTPGIRLHMPALPAEAVTGTLLSATLFLNVSANSGGSYAIRALSPQGESGQKTVTLTTGVNSIDASDILGTDAQILHIGNVASGSSQALNIMSTESGSGPAVVVRYAVDHGATLVDAEVAGIEMIGVEADIDVTTSPDVVIDVGTPSIVVPEPEAEVVLHQEINLSDTDTVLMGAYEADVELTNGVAIDMDTPRILVTRVQVTDVNGEPVLPSESEDPYFVSTMDTLEGIRRKTGGGLAGTGQERTIEPHEQIWYRMNERSGTKARDRLYNLDSYGREMARGTLDLNNVTIGLNDGPDGRHHFYFNGDAFAVGSGAGGRLQEEDSLEFTFRTTKKTQFLMGAANAWGNLSAQTPDVWELWMVDGRLEQRIRYFTTFVPGAPGEWYERRRPISFTDLADGQWHHIVLQVGYHTWLHDRQAEVAGANFRMELYVDGRLEMRSRTNVALYGTPQYIGGRPGGYGRGVSAGELPRSQWFNGDMTEFVYRFGRALSEDEIVRQRDGVMGIQANHVEPARIITQTEDAVVKGNKPRMLVLNFNAGTDAWDRTVYFSLESDARRVRSEAGGGGAPLRVPIAFVGLGESVTHYPMADKSKWPDMDYLKFHYNVAGEGRAGVGQFLYKDRITDNYRLLDLDLDLNMDDFDIISIAGFPGDEGQMGWYDVIDSRNASPMVPARQQLDRLLNQIKDQVINHGKSLFVADPFSAIQMGIIDQVDVVPEADENAGKFNASDSRMGAINPGFDARAAMTDPFSGGSPTGRLEDMTGQRGWDAILKASARYVDTHAIDRQRVRAVVEGLTTIPGYIKVDELQWWNVNPFNEPPWEISRRFEYKQSLGVGDEFYLDAPQFDDGSWRSIDVPAARYVWKHDGYRVAAPMSAVKVGTVVTSFTMYHFMSHKGVAGVSADGNPFYDHAISIAIQPGDSWDGKTVQGKVYVNFTESTQLMADRPHMDRMQTWKHLGDTNSNALELNQEVRYRSGGSWRINNLMARYQFSTHFGGFGGTEITLPPSSKPDWGWSAGGVRGSGLSGGAAHAMNWSWQSLSDLKTIPLPTMSERGLKWLATDLDLDGEVRINAAPVTASVAAHDVVVEATSNAVVDLSTARTHVESHSDTDTVDPDVTVMAGTASVALKTHGLNEHVLVSTATVSVQAQELDNSADEVIDWSEVIVLTMPRQIAILTLEDN